MIDNRYTSTWKVPGGVPWVQSGELKKIHGVISEGGNRVTVKVRDRYLDIQVIPGDAVYITSQLPEGFTEKLVIPIKEARRGRTR